MMKIVIACDSFKESMTAIEACHAVEKGIKAVDETIDCQCIPMADGGEGTTEVLMNATHANSRYIEVHNPFDEVIQTSYGISEDGSAIMEVASSCGLDLIPREKRNPTHALSVGLGEMIKDAICHQSKKIIIGLGGSGTNDGGFGMLYALGTQFFDENHQALPLEFSSLFQIYDIDISYTLDLLKDCELIVASDVDNVFAGPLGATYVFGTQKGASDKQLQYLEKSLVHFQTIIKEKLDIDLSEVKKSGAAGGIGGALYLLGAKMMSGIELVLQVTEFAKHIKDADYIVTGEGSIDAQTIQGKTISGIAKVAKRNNVSVIAFGGRVDKDASNLYDIGVSAMFSITNEVKTLPEALEDGDKSLRFTVENVIRLLVI